VAAGAVGLGKTTLHDGGPLRRCLPPGAGGRAHEPLPGRPAAPHQGPPRRLCRRLAGPPHRAAPLLAGVRGPADGRGPHGPVARSPSYPRPVRAHGIRREPARTVAALVQLPADRVRHVTSGRARAGGHHAVPLE
jgi:hypothetical protein